MELGKKNCCESRQIINAAVAEWQTRTLEGRVGNRAGSSPVGRTKDFYTIIRKTHSKNVN